MESVRKITPLKAIEILKKVHISVDENEAKLILDFLYGLADITIDAHLARQPNSDPKEQNN